MVERTPENGQQIRAVLKVSRPVEQGKEGRRGGGTGRCVVSEPAKDAQSVDATLLDLAGLAHDLRAPLAAIRQLTEVMLGEHYGPVTPAQREALEAVLRRCTDLDHLVSNMLDLARSECGRLKPCLGPVQVAEAIASALDRVGLTLKAKHVHVRTEGIDSATAVLADAEMLERILTNLLTNAVAVTPTGGTITLRLSQLSLRHVRIEIADQGPGMDAAAVRQLLRPFRRGTTADHPGYGLGLSIVRRLAKAQHASINVRSAPGRGTVFAVTFLKFDPVLLVRRFATQAAQGTAVGCLCRIQDARLVKPMHRLLSEELPTGIALPLHPEHAVLLIAWGETAQATLEKAIQHASASLKRPILRQWLDQEALKRWPKSDPQLGPEAKDAGVAQAS